MVERACQASRYFRIECVERQNLISPKTIATPIGRMEPQYVCSAELKND